MSNAQQAHDILRGVPEKIVAGLHDEVMDLLAKVDELDPSRFKETTNFRHEVAAARTEEEPSAGTSFLTSESKLDKNGTSTGTDLPSPAPDAESPSEADPQARPPSSTASGTDTSIQGTSSVPASPPDSSEASAPAKPATPAQASSKKK